MSHSSERKRRPTRKAPGKHLGALRRDQRGVVLPLFAIVSIVILVGAGIVVDLGVAHVTKSKLGRAVDAGVIAGARYAPRGVTEVRRVAEEIASANYGSASSANAASYELEVDSPAIDTFRVRLTGRTAAPTLFSRLTGRDKIDVAAFAEATRFPLDMTLLLDLSASLARNNAFDDMQDAAVSFLRAFDDSVDQVGLAAYSTWAWELLPIEKNFQLPGEAIIRKLRAISDTNIEEGLRIAKMQLDSASKRESSLKVVVLFTDGRPTAFADGFWMDPPKIDCPDAIPSPPPTDRDGDGTPDCFVGVIATYVNGNAVRGLFLREDGRKVVGFRAGRPILATNLSRRWSPKPKQIAPGIGVNGTQIRRVAADQAEEWANEIRAAGYTIYTVGLGNPNARIALDQPDLDFLRRIANDRGIVDPNQPKGEMLFAPTPEDLEATFAKLADRILTRLTQ